MVLYAGCPMQLPNPTVFYHRSVSDVKRKRRQIDQWDLNPMSGAATQLKQDDLGARSCHWDLIFQTLNMCGRRLVSQSPEVYAAMSTMVH